MARVGVETTDRAARVENIARMLMQLSWLAQKQFAQSLAEHDLTFPQFLVLANLARASQHCSMNELAAATHQDAATMTGIVDRLQRLGLVARARSERDRRVVLVAPTRQGELLLAAVRQTRNRMTKRLFDPLDDEALHHLEAHLERLWSLLEQHSRATER